MGRPRSAAAHSSIAHCGLSEWPPTPFHVPDEKIRAAFCERYGFSTRTAPKAGAGVDIKTLESWAGRALPMGSVQSPDPREMTLEELTALGCTIRSPAKALKAHDRERDSNYADRTARRRAQETKHPGQIGHLTREAPQEAIQVPPGGGSVENRGI